MTKRTSGATSSRSMSRPLLTTSPHYGPFITVVTRYARVPYTSDPLLRNLEANGSPPTQFFLYFGASIADDALFVNVYNPGGRLRFQQSWILGADSTIFGVDLYAYFDETATFDYSNADFVVERFSFKHAFLGGKRNAQKQKTPVDAVPVRTFARRRKHTSGAK